MYGAAAAGGAGIAKAYEILAAEMLTGLMQIGCPSPDDIDVSFAQRGLKATEMTGSLSARVAPLRAGPSAAQ